MTAPDGLARALAPMLLCVAPGLVAVMALLVLVGLRQLSAADTIETYGRAPSFDALVDDHGRVVSDDEFRGKVLVANFVYTECTDICPLLSAQMRGLQERLRREGLLGDHAQLLSFSVDPSRDTPEVLRAYAERYQADPTAWRFLTGTENVLVPLIVEGFLLGVTALPPPMSHDGEGHTDSYEVMHSGRFVLIDREWRVRAYYDARELDLDRVVRQVRRLAG